MHGTVRLWDIATGTLTTRITGRYEYHQGFENSTHQGGISDIAFSPDGRTLAIADGFDTVRLWSVAPNPRFSETEPSGAP